MAGREDAFEGVRLGVCEDSDSLAKVFNKHVKTKDVFFLCVGTDRLSGDSFAPFVGTYLTKLGYENVLGTIDEPVHAQNLDKKIALIPDGKIVIAIDAGVGKNENIGKLLMSSGKLHAGAGVGKKLTPVGDFVIHGIVNINSRDASLNLKVLAATRLSTVLRMAEQCVKAIEVSFPLQHVTKHKFSAII